jgi:hypothetical protein
VTRVVALGVSVILEITLHYFQLEFLSSLMNCLFAILRHVYTELHVKILIKNKERQANLLLIGNSRCR